MAVYTLTAYPKPGVLRDRREVVIRPVEPDDESALLAFFQRLPASERYFLKHDVTSSSVISHWTHERDFDRALPLVAVYDERIVADAVLARSRHGAYRNVAGVRVAVDPDFRQQGLGLSMLRELCDIAKDADLSASTLSWCPAFRKMPSRRPNSWGSFAPRRSTRCSVMKTAGCTTSW